MDQKIPFSNKLFVKIFLVIAYILAGFSFLYISGSLIRIISKTVSIIDLSLNMIVLIGEAIGLTFAIYLFILLALAVENSLKEPVAFTKSFTPPVTVILPIFNEPLDVLRLTLENAMKLDYPSSKLEIFVVDDSTQLNLVEETRKFCSTLGIRYKHRTNRTGFKAGAINSILKETNGDFLLILDADQIPLPHLLKSTIPYFIDRKVALVQAKLTFRNMDCITRKSAGLVHIEFYEVLDKAKDRIRTASFSGTTGVLRKTALLEIGGMSEDTIVEDADTSFKLLARGYQGRLADTYGSIGLVPWHFSSHIAQYWRIAQGTTAILRKRTGLILRSKLPLLKKLDLILSATVFLASVSILILATALGIMSILEIPLIRVGENYPFFLLMPFSIMLAHIFNVILALRWGDKQQDIPHHSLWEIIPFNILSIMILPFMISAVFSGLRGNRRVFQRTAKYIPGKQSIKKEKGPISSQNVLRTSLLSFILGLFLISSGLLGLMQFNMISGFLISIGLCFLLPVPLIINDYRIYGVNKVAIAT
ncbi:MAG: glycosyltransferase [Candidatus Hodarchaeales archaeon]|jgi:cellulose synthase/poly-beta-1,6-N-acetylglucosamine synthase-like glycosyltransferase